MEIQPNAIHREQVISHLEFRKELELKLSQQGRKTALEPYKRKVSISNMNVIILLCNASHRT